MSFPFSDAAIFPQVKLYLVLNGQKARPASELILMAESKFGRPDLRQSFS
jgi:hypothetical protein